ncbi:MAG: EAL domain-containing protein [Oscillospiraceae bacterium]|nr:EAL domain-containing protein [Oscillospiraceae bacterium]
MDYALQVSFDNYTPAGDVAVIALCLVVVFLLLSSFVNRTRSFLIFMNIVASLLIAALVNILYHSLLLTNSAGLHVQIYVSRVLYQALLLDVFFLFALYTTEVSGLEHAKARIVAIAASTLMLAVIGIDIFLTATGTGFRIADDGTVMRGPNVYMVGYVLFVVLMVMLLRRVERLLYKRVMQGFYAVVALSVAVQVISALRNQSTLTTMSFVFPVIAMLYVFHSNPYNVTLGSVDIHAMEDMVRSLSERKKGFVFLSLLLPEYEEEGKDLPESVRAVIRSYSETAFRGGILFQIGKGHMVMMAPKYRNPDWKRRISECLDGFGKEFRRFRKNYKIVIGEEIEEISRENAYVGLIMSVEHSMPENSIRRVEAEDISRFKQEEYILRELADIYHKADVEDERVLAFCQPVYNLRTGRFDTAEALMRLRLPETGIVYPDQFIPMAESHGYIHVLTEIILHKTCREIRKMTEEGFQINRVSVNVSVLELKEDEFCGDITSILEGNNVPGGKVAIELTESNSEADFLLMQNKIEQLRAKGIQFYLDDFGTGYSNMERIMELPFDIIKFDRSMVLASAEDHRSEKIVESLASMFNDMDYDVLYEGIEDEMDEKRCRDMNASYLQGYKYSRPIPIERLRDFLPKVG